MASTLHGNHPDSNRSALQTNRFSFLPVRNLGADNQTLSEEMEVLICERFTHVNAGRVFIQDPDKQWESMKDDEILRTHAMEWALARLLLLFRQTNPQIDLAELLSIDGKEVRLPLIVRDKSGRLISYLALTGKKEACFWQGPSRSYLLGKNACEELEALMFEQPEQLTEYQIAVPWRKSFGWNGTRFLSQRIVQRPDHYSPEKIASRRNQRVIANNPPIVEKTFRIAEQPRFASSHESSDSKRPHRYTNVWPPPEAWVNIPNWRHAYDEEGRSNQDESTIKPTRTQTFISDDVDYTAAEAWLADGQVVPAILCLSSGRVTRIVCFFELIFWEFDCGSFDVSEITPEQRSKFPIRAVSRLSQSSRDPDQTIRVMINQSGRLTQIRMHLNRH